MFVVKLFTLSKKRLKPNSQQFPPYPKKLGNIWPHSYSSIWIIISEELSAEILSEWELQGNSSAIDRRIQ